MGIRRPKKNSGGKAIYFETVLSFENKTDIGLKIDFTYPEHIEKKAQQLLSTGWQSNASGTIIDTTSKIDLKINGLIFINGVRFMIKDKDIIPINNISDMKSKKGNKTDTQQRLILS